MREKRIKGPFDPTLYYVFKAIKVDGESLNESEDGLSIEEDDVDNYLLPLLEKYFDQDLELNTKRINKQGNAIEGFAWNNAVNYYTYRNIHSLCLELEDISIALIMGETNELIESIKASVDEFEPKVVIDFYHNLVTRLRLIMANNSDLDIIGVVAP